MTDGTTGTSTMFADVAQLVEQCSRKATVAGSMPVIGSVIAMILALVLACVPANYAKALDTCAFDHVGDRPSTLACQCDVARQYGRDCGFLQTDAAVASVDGAASQDSAPKE